MRWRILIALASCVLATACATARSPEQQRRVSDCLAACRGNEAPPQRTGPFDQNAGRPNQSSSCVDGCESIK